MKRCARCHQFLSLNSFYRQSAQPDGLRAYCKECWKTDCAQRHARKREGMVDKRRILMESVRHDYFSQIERPIQAYVLGLLASDGNVSDARPRIALSVHEKDKWLVEVARDELAPMRPITLARHRDYHMAKIALTSPQMVSDLAHFEIVPRKSATLRWPAALPQTLANSYLLGVYDGDGWITRDLRKPVPYFTAGIISASQGFLQAACAAIYEATGLEAPCLSPVNQRAFGIRYGGRRAETLLAWLHQDLPGLQRKRYPTLPAVGDTPTAAC